MRNWWRWTFCYEVRRRWEQRWVWRIIALLPRELKKWVVVQAAVKAEWDGHPTSVTYVEMARVYE
jgi:hypothetical protein